jgi:hypothetical protein
VPGGPFGAAAWRLLGPVANRAVDGALRALARRVEGAA